MPRQTVLPVDNTRDASLANFFGERNHALVEELGKLVRGERPKRVLYLWGAEGSGKSHLLHACCHAFSMTGRTPVYLALAQQNIDTGLIQDVPGNTLVCVDDIDLVSGNKDFLVHLLALYERLFNSSGKLVVSGNASVQSLGLALDDLSSRLTSGGVYQALVPDDDEKRAALKARASARGFSLDDNVVEFIMSHSQRDMPSLFGLLDRLDSASLEAHRKITIPFVRSQL